MITTTMLASSHSRRASATSQSGEAYRLIKERIITLELPPAAVVDEARLMADLGLGRTPIREALQRLALENLVVILPRRGTPTRELFERAVSLRGLKVPPHVVETSSLVTLRGLLLESDRITILSRHQVLIEEQCGLLAVLNFELHGTARPIGITIRRRGSMSPAAALLAQEIRCAAAASARGDGQGAKLPFRPAAAAVGE